MSNKDTAPATVYMTIKDDHGSLLYRKELTLGSSNQLTGSTIKVADGSVLAQKMSAGKIQVTYSILNELENATAKLTIFRDSVVSPATAGSPAVSRPVKVSTVNASVYSSFNRFDYGQLYKGWGSFAWNGTAKNVAIPKDKMKIPETNEYYHDGKVNESAVEANEMDINRQLFFTLSYLPEKKYFVSATDSAYVGSVVMRPSRLGEDDIIVDTVDYNIQGGGLAAPVLLTESKSRVRHIIWDSHWESALESTRVIPHNNPIILYQPWTSMVTVTLTG